MVLKLFTTFIVVAAILASPKHRDFTWSYRSSIHRVHWYVPKQRFVYHAINDWNNLNLERRQSNNLSSFKNSIASSKL